MHHLQFISVAGQGENGWDGVTPTPAQIRCLSTIDAQTLRLGRSPTLVEVGEVLGLSKTAIFEHVRALQNLGFVRRAGLHHKQKTIEIIKRPKRRSTVMMLVGTIS